MGHKRKGGVTPFPTFREKQSQETRALLFPSPLRGGVRGVGYSRVQCLRLIPFPNPRGEGTEGTD